jgi:hypothetical protein
MYSWQFSFLFPRCRLGLTGMYKIGIGVFIQAGKLTGAISRTSISNYDLG